MAHDKYPGPYVDGPTASDSDLMYCAWQTGATVDTQLIKPQPTPEQINRVFGTGGPFYDPENPPASDAVKATVATFKQWQKDQKQERPPKA